jgi:hypothetical protein
MSATLTRAIAGRKAWGAAVGYRRDRIVHDDQDAYFEINLA